MPRKSTRGAKGGGSIRQRPDGRWEGRYSYVDELGVTRRRSVYADKQAACRKLLTEAIRAVDNGSHRVTKDRYTVETWLDTWLSAYNRTWKPRTVADYRSKADRYIIPAIGSVQLSALTPLIVQRFCNRLSDGFPGQNPLSPKSVRNIHGILHSALKQAVADGILADNPADNTKLPKPQKPKLRPLMDDDVARFAAACETHKYGRLYMIDLFTGLRQSELLGLQWDDVDLDDGIITVRRQLQKVRGEKRYIYLDQTKNGKARQVPISPSIIALFRTQQAQQAALQLAAGSLWDNPRNLVFTNELGEHLAHSTIQNRFRMLVRSIGLEGVRFHDLRHSCAILALQSGCSIKATQELMGHYSSSFTMDVYADVSRTMQQDTRDKMEDVFRSCKGSKLG